MGRLVWAAWLLVLAGHGYAAAADGPSAPIATDRPAVTDSSVVVPVGSLVAENGITDSVNGGKRIIDATETLLRLGVGTKTEVRLTVPDYFGAASGPSGFGDPLIGMKQQLGPAPGGFDVSVILSLSLPTGAKAISSHGYDASLQLPWSHAVSSNWTAEGMLSVYSPTQAGRHNVTGETTFLMDRQLTKTWDAFVEYAGDFPERGGPRHLLHIGTALKTAPAQQVDLHFGVGLSSAAADHFIGFGYSFRLQAFHHRGQP